MEEAELMKPNVHIVSYTHWDREFRWEFEHTRMKFVECMDHLLEIMREKPDYKSFLLDGQVGLLDDYLEIRPEVEEEIRGLIEQRKLEIGPWYSLPDCATIHGESVIRNLQHGVRVSESYGSVLKCGYNVFSFGQIAQLPQIYKHFGIDIIIFYKYMNPVRSKLPEFVWGAPDGTQVFASRLGREARWNFFFAGHIPIVYDRDPWDKEWHYDYGTLGKVVHTAGPADYGFFHEILDPDTSYHKKNIEMGFQRSLETVEGTAAPETLLFFDGTDFTEPHPMIPEIIADLQEKFGDQYNIQHSTLAAYLEELKAAMAAKRDELALVSGAMRDGPVGSIHTDVITTHPELKIANSTTENRLVRYAEPLSTMAWAQGIDRYPDTYLEKAWKLLFASHAHDSIHGLGPVELGQGGMARIQQADLIAQALERKGLNNLTKEIATDDMDDAEMFLAVHNTAAFTRSEVVEVWVDIPAEVALDEVVLEDMAGNVAEIQEVRRETARGGIYHPRSRNMPYYCTRVQLLFLAEDIPGLGHKTYKIKWTAKAEYPYPHEDWDAPKLIAKDLLVAPREARNEHVHLLINGDGTFDLTDLTTGHTCRNLNHLLDVGDVGNMWMANAPEGDAIMQSIGGPAEIRCSLHGDLAAAFEIKTSMVVPARYDFAANRRSDDSVTLTAVTTVILKKGSRFVEVQTTLDNTARDHYVRVCFPTGLQATTTCADGSFAVTEYATNPDLSCELARHPVQLWLDLHDDDKGLALLSKSTKDYEILNDNGGQTLAVGLVRSTRLRIACDNRLWMEYPGDESSQSLNSQTHNYALMPHAKTWNEDGLYHQALAYNQPLKPVQFGRQPGRLAPTFSFLEVADPNLVLSAVTKAVTRDSVFVRLFNPTTDDIDAALVLGVAVRSAYVTRLTEKRDIELRIEDGSIRVVVKKGEIVTVEFELEEASIC